MDLVHPADTAQITAMWDAARAESVATSKTVPTTFTFRCLRKDGSFIWVESNSCITPTHVYAIFRRVSGAPRKRTAARVLTPAAFVRVAARSDISDRKRLEVRSLAARAMPLAISA